MMKKNSIVELIIEDMGVTGDGIGKLDGFPLFVKDTIIGDKIMVRITKLKKNYGYGRLEEIVKPSPDRVEAPCPVNRRCGGCQIQCMSYPKQLEYKERKVLNNLQRIGGIAEVPMEPIIGMEDPWHYRNKAQHPVGLNQEGELVTGFYASRTHSIMPFLECELGPVENAAILQKVLDYMNENGVTSYDEKSHKGLVRHILIRKGFTTGEIMVCLVVNGDKIPEEENLISRLQTIEGMKSISLSPNKKRTNVIMGTSSTTIWGTDTITDYIGELAYEISPLSFYQVNPVQTEKLYETALHYAGLTGKEVVWDLYCGIGTISLFMAKKAKQVYGVEIVPEAIEDANKNAKINNITNVEFKIGRAEEVVPQAYEEDPQGANPDVIVVDPPRRGCDEVLLDTILKMKPQKVVYVSCDSATLARDVKILSDGGYKLEKVRPCDMFPMTIHVETVVLMSRK